MGHRIWIGVSIGIDKEQQKFQTFTAATARAGVLVQWRKNLSLLLKDWTRLTGWTGRDYKEN